MSEGRRAGGWEVVIVDNDGRSEMYAYLRKYTTEWSTDSIFLFLQSIFITIADRMT